MGGRAARAWIVGPFAIARFALGAIALFALSASACKHDLNELKSERGRVLDAGKGGGGNKPGTGGRGGGSGGGAGRGGSGGSAPQDAGPLCGPCDELSGNAKTLGLRSCCRGPLGDECGLTIGDAMLCLPRMVPSQENAACTEVRVLGGMTLAGCCRPDGRCGVVAHGSGLGCVAREELGPVVSGTPPNSIPCDYSCEADEDCRGVLRGLVCAETPDHTARVCSVACQRDADCARGQGLLCGLSADEAMGRVLAICRTPLGDLVPGDNCSRAEDCLHGICSQPKDGTPPFCSQLCRIDTDCKVGFRDCMPTDMDGKDAGMGQNFSVCLPPMAQ